MSSIIPIIYLFLVSTILTPIMLILLIQTFNFNHRKRFLLDITKGNNFNEAYELMKIYIGQKEWVNALATLDMHIHKDKNPSSYTIARCSSAIEFVLQKTSHGKLAKKYYYYSHQADPKHSNTKKNSDKLKNI